MKVKTSELIGNALRWAVAAAEDQPVKIVTYGAGPLVVSVDPSGWTRGQYHPDTDWSQGGPIIERKEIGIKRNAPCSDGRQWEASPSITAKGAGGKYAYGPTALAAAMRCFVASTLGDEVDVPEELL